MTVIHGFGIWMFRCGVYVWVSVCVCVCISLTTKISRRDSKLDGIQILPTMYRNLVGIYLLLHNWWMVYWVPTRARLTCPTSVVPYRGGQEYFYEFMKGIYLFLWKKISIFFFYERRLWYIYDLWITYLYFYEQIF